MTRFQPLLVGADNDIWVMQEPSGRFAVRRGRHTWALNLYVDREEAIAAGRRLAQVWRCKLLVLDSEGEIAALERHDGL